MDVVPYVHQEIEALPYVHDATGGKKTGERLLLILCCSDVSDDSSPEALAYVHDVTGGREGPSYASI